MNREIKFRGKSKDNIGEIEIGDWLYGGIVFDNDRYWIDIPYYGNIIVDKNTIGQYTGLKDKNGKEIYEGDIILTQPFSNKPFSQKKKEKRLRGIVTYNIKCGKNFVGEPDKLKYWGAEWNVEIIDKEDYKKYCYWSWGAFFECEVIGNIYDNPELLEV